MIFTSGFISSGIDLVASIIIPMVAIILLFIFPTHTISIIAIIVFSQAVIMFAKVRGLQGISYKQYYDRDANLHRRTMYGIATTIDKQWKQLGNNGICPQCGDPLNGEFVLEVDNGGVIKIKEEATIVNCAKLDCGWAISGERPDVKIIITEEEN